MHIFAKSILVLIIATQLHAQDFDIEIAVDSENRIATFGGNLYRTELNPLRTSADQTLNLFFASNPGVNARFNLPVGYSKLPADSLLSLSMASFGPVDAFEKSQLWHWDGVDHDGDGTFLDDIDFSPVNDGTSFTLSRGPTTLTLPSDAADLPLAVTSPNGGVHVHPNYDVYRVAPEVPADGFYLTSATFQMEGLGESTPIYMMFNTPNLASGAHAAIGAWFPTAFPVPEPAGAPLLAFGGIVALHLRRRRERLVRR